MSGGPVNPFARRARGSRPRRTRAGRGPGGRCRGRALRRAARSGTGRVEGRRVPPQPLETVEPPGLRREDVHDDVEEVEQDPLAALVPLHVSGALSLGVETLDDRVADGLGLAALAAGDDHESIREGGEAAHVEGDRVFAFAVGGRLEDQGHLPVQLNGVSSLDGAGVAPGGGVIPGRGVAPGGDLHHRPQGFEEIADPLAAGR